MSSSEKRRRGETGSHDPSEAEVLLTMHRATGDIRSFLCTRDEMRDYESLMFDDVVTTTSLTLIMLHD
jgi:hypothetical protein